MSWILPVGLDFADGVTALFSQPIGTDVTPTVVGTKLPTASLSIFSNSGNNIITVEEPPGSPHIERAEQCTCSHTLSMSWAEVRFYLTMIGRGEVVQDTEANIWRILSCDGKRLNATTGELSYVMESISFDSPPDDFQINDTSLDLDIIKHPRYAWALNPYVTDASTYVSVGDIKIFYTEIKEAIIRMIQAYKDSPFYPSQAQVNGLIQLNIMSMLNLNSNTKSGTTQIHYPNKSYDPSKPTVDPVPWDGKNSDLPTANCMFFLVSAPVDLSDRLNPVTIAIAAAKELISKLWRQEDTPYISGYEIVWVQYYFAPVYLNPGGYVEDPRDVVPSYFISPFNDGIIPRANQNDPFGGDTSNPGGSDGQSVFDYFTHFNPQLYSTTGLQDGPLSFSCLRLSDHEEYERTWFKVPHKWLCAPIGKWDSDLYTQDDRPQSATDYNQLPNAFGG